MDKIIEYANSRCHRRNFQLNKRSVQQDRDNSFDACMQSFRYSRPDTEMLYILAMHERHFEGALPTQISNCKIIVYVLEEKGGAINHVFTVNCTLHFSNLKLATRTVTCLCPVLDHFLWVAYIAVDVGRDWGSWNFTSHTTF